MSIVWKLYASHAQPFIRVVYGRLDSWDSYTAATIHPFKIPLATWSPCNRFIAISGSSSPVVDILDSVTLQKLQSLQSRVEFRPKNLIFSPESRILTSCGQNGGETIVVSWDLQTGCIAGMIRWDGYPHKIYTTQSSNGKIVAVLHEHPYPEFSISICDIASSRRTHNIDVPKGCLPCGLWTHGESLRFPVIDWTAAEGAGAKSITIWEVGFTPGATATEVETLPTPEPVKSPVCFPLFFPLSFTHSQSPPTPRPPMVYCYDNNVLVLDAQTSKILLHLQGIEKAWKTTCSSGGCFFACSVPGSGIYLWKDSPTGYVLYETPPSLPLYSTPLLSPDGESIIVISNSIIRLWPTKSFPNTPSDTVFKAREIDGFSLEFLPNRSSAVFSRKGDSTVTVLDFRSGVPQLTINTGMKVRALGVTGDIIVTMSDEGATTWKVPEGTPLPGATMNVVDSIQTIKFCFQHKDHLEVEAGLLSPDSRYIIVKEGSQEFHVYSATDGKLVHRSISLGSRLWITTNGRTLGSIIGEDVGYLFEITTQGALTGEQEVDPRLVEHGFPCTSSDYKVLDDGWILGPSRERLLILPPLWRSDMWQRVWNGRFLMLLHGALPEPVIIELPEPLSHLLRSLPDSSVECSL